jgi:hypothetical protein
LVAPIPDSSNETTILLEIKVSKKIAISFQLNPASCSLMTLAGSLEMAGLVIASSPAVVRVGGRVRNHAEPISMKIGRAEKLSHAMSPIMCMKLMKEKYTSPAPVAENKSVADSCVVMIVNYILPYPVLCLVPEIWVEGPSFCG